MQFQLPVETVLGIAAPAVTRGHAAVAAVTGLASLSEAGPGQLSFLGNPKYRKDLPGCKASVVLVPQDCTDEPPAGQLHVLVANPSFVLAKICAHLADRMRPAPQPGVHPSAVVEAGAEIAPDASVGPLCHIAAGARVGARARLESQVFVGAGASIGEESWLSPRVVVEAGCVVGRRVRIQPGAVIGSDGFGFETVQGRHIKVPQIGNVVVGDDVEIGANTTIDRARFSSTVIGEGTKVDNLVQIAHNVVIGKHCLIVSQAGIAGSTTLEDYVILGGQVGVAGHIRLGKGAICTAQTGVNADLEPGVTVRGSPALGLQAQLKNEVLIRRLPDLFKRVAELEKGAGDAAK